MKKNSSELIIKLGGKYRRNTYIFIVAGMIFGILMFSVSIFSTIEQSKVIFSDTLLMIFGLILILSSYRTCVNLNKLWIIIIRGNIFSYVDNANKKKIDISLVEIKSLKISIVSKSVPRAGHVQIPYLIILSKDYNELEIPVTAFQKDDLVKMLNYLKQKKLIMDKSCLNISENKWNIFKLELKHRAIKDFTSDIYSLIIFLGLVALAIFILSLLKH